MQSGKGNTGTSFPSGGSDSVAQISDLQDLETKFYTKLEEYDKKADERQIKSVEVLGIFVAFFSFISVSIQIFNRISSVWSAGLFVLLIFCALAIIIVLIDILLKLNDKSRDFKDIFYDFRFILIVVFLLVGIVSVIVLRNFPLNAVYGTIEFEEAVNRRIDDKINGNMDNFIKKNDFKTIEDKLNSIEIKYLELFKQ